MRKVMTLIVNRKWFIVILILLTACYLLLATGVRADELSDIQKQIDDLQKSLDSSKSATSNLEVQVKSMDSQVSALSARLDAVGKELAAGEKDLARQKKILAATVRNFYIRSFINIPFLTFFSSGDATDTLKLIAFQQATSKGDKDIISDISQKIAKLADDKKRLATARVQIDKQRQFLKGEIASAKSFQSQVEGKISQLSARQQEIIAARSGEFVASIGDSELADDYNASIKGFRESAPSGSFAVFSFGAYTHRKGMSQYGARGRAESGQDYKAILRAYYGKEPVGKDT